MAESCGCIRARSSSDSSSRASLATRRTSSSDRDMASRRKERGVAGPPTTVGPQRLDPPGTAGSDVDADERLDLDRPLDAAAAHALGADADPDRLAVDDGLDLLEVRLERPPAHPGDLLTDPAEVLGLAAVGLLVAEDGLLPAHRALHAHDRNLVTPRPGLGSAREIGTITIAAAGPAARTTPERDGAGRAGGSVECRATGI